MISTDWAKRPLAFVLFVISFAGISVRRVRDIGLPGWIGLFVPFFFAADWQFLVTTGAPWTLAISAGILDLSFPFFTLLGLVTNDRDETQLALADVLSAANNDRILAVLQLVEMGQKLKLFGAFDVSISAKELLRASMLSRNPRFGGARPELIFT